MSSAMTPADSSDNANHDAQLVGISVAFVVLSFLGIACRLVSKRMKRSSLMIDDNLLLMAFVRLFLILQCHV